MENHYIYIYIPLLNPHRFPSHLLIFPLETLISDSDTVTRTESLEKAAGGFLVDDGLAQPRYSFLEYSWHGILMNDSNIYHKLW